MASDHLDLAIPPSAMARLHALKEKTHGASYAEVIANALQIYEALIEEVESGKQFLTKDKDGVFRIVKVLT